MLEAWSSDDFFARAVSHAKALGAKTVVDTAGASLRAVLAEGVTLIKPNLVELAELVGSALDSDGDRVGACRKLVADGGAQAVALTLGEQGALLVTATRAWRAQPMAIEVTSTVGAGDSFLGGMVSALAAGKPLEQAFRVAVAAGSAAAMSPGTELCSEMEVLRLLPDVKISEIEVAVA